MSPNQSRADASEYPVVTPQDAALRADRVVAVIGLDTDVGLEDRLEREFDAWMDRQEVGYLVHEVKHLYWLLTDPESNPGRQAGGCPCPSSFADPRDVAPLRGRVLARLPADPGGDLPALAR